MDVGSGRISVVQVAREPEVARGARTYAAYSVSLLEATDFDAAGRDTGMRRA
jgi:hypothetical protein